MDLVESILNRRSIRNFKPDPVSVETITRLIEISRWSPSGSNTQPWEFIVLGGGVLEEVKKRIADSAKSGADHPDIPYPPMPEPYISRQKAVGKAMQTYLQNFGTDNTANINRIPVRLLLTFLVRRWVSLSVSIKKYLPGLFWGWVWSPRPYAWLPWISV